MTLPRLPSRYEDLDRAFRGRLRPAASLLELIKQSYSTMKVAGGIRFLPIFGESGSGKTCAALEIGTHLPECKVLPLDREAVADSSLLNNTIGNQQRLNPAAGLLVFVVDQHEERVAERTAVPSQFVEQLSLLDRGTLRGRPTMFLWLTTSREFQESLQEATRRNRRILVKENYELTGPPRAEWPGIIEETFSFHNEGKALADFEVLASDLDAASREQPSIGAAIEHVAGLLADHSRRLQDISRYRVVMLWPVTDATRISRVTNFTDARAGYKLDWGAFYRELSEEDKARLPLREYNRARLYFDVRLVPIAAADLHRLCLSLDDDGFLLHKSYLDRFRSTHFYSIITDSWRPEAYASLRERPSERARSAKEWYDNVTRNSTQLGRRIARILRALGHEGATHEHEIKSPHGTVRADTYLELDDEQRNKIIIELKAYRTDYTRPSSIRDAIRETLKRHARFAGFLAQQ